MMSFVEAQIDGVGEVLIPRGLKLVLPAVVTVAADKAHLLLEIPWEERYLERVPAVYRAFFREIQPHLAVRTTDVHTATSVGFVGELLDGYSRAVNGHLVYVALLLHDSGWSRVGQQEIVDSLDASGLLHKNTLASGVERHDVEGAKICSEVLPSQMLDPALTMEQIAYITDIVGHHTRGMVMDASGQRRPEMEIVMDADRLWSFTRENFWQDTVRKGIAPAKYLESIREMVPYYLVTERGREVATAMVREREAEVGTIDVT